MAKANWQCPNEWSEWSEWLAAGLHARNRWRLPVLLTGILFAVGRRTVTSWLRAVGVSDDFQDYYYFLAPLGRKAEFGRHATFSARAADLALARPAAGGHRRLPHQAVRAQGRRGRHPPQSHARPCRPEVSLWTHLGHAVAGPAASVVGRAGPAAAGHAVRPPEDDSHHPQEARLAISDQARTGGPLGGVDRNAGEKGGKNVVGGRRRRVHQGALLEAGHRRGHDRHWPTPQGRGPARPASRRCGAASDADAGRPRTYGKNRISLAKRAGHKQGWQTIECTAYGKTTTKTYKTFLATYEPVGGVIRVVIVKEEHDWFPFFSTDPDASVVEIIEAFADRATIEQDFHDVKEVWGAGQQQVRNIWTNVAVYHLNLWMHTLVELWAWNRSHKELCDRSDSPWDDPERRPSHADRRKALRRHIHAKRIISGYRRLVVAAKNPRAGSTPHGVGRLT